MVMEDGWMQPSAVTRKGSCNIALVTCRMVSMNDGSSRVGTAEDDDGWDGIVKGAVQPWVILEDSSQGTQQLFSNHG
ncbi:predicted protein [Lichtheimia corymbifera JMRC:FSU:9682]|uniref:Uncharacterized protein n=1 Tax=Lichtheimia corymbifera JMRC:FSU:9682 TaxID=1263082 RepID=A0A068REU2_9FUNG|nr:predicted protein [Lichtheimia corymbifera JMRC:FSU:9682]